jgi:hypothetical protein
MNEVLHMTLADLRASDPADFDAAIKQAVFAAAEDVGHQTLFAAFYGASEETQLLKAA